MINKDLFDLEENLFGKLQYAPSPDRKGPPQIRRLPSILADLTGKDFLYALNRNKSKVKTSVKGIIAKYQNEKTKFEHLKEYEEYSAKRNELEEKYKKEEEKVYIKLEELNSLKRILAIKKEELKTFTGDKAKHHIEEAILDVEDKIFTFSDLEKSVNEELNTLKEVKADALIELNSIYDAAIKDRNAYSQLWEKILQEETEIEFHRIRYSTIPDNINDSQYEVIADMVYMDLNVERISENKKEINEEIVEVK